MKTNRLCAIALFWGASIPGISGANGLSSNNPGALPPAVKSADAPDQVLITGRGFAINRSQLDEEERVHLDEVTEMEEGGLSRRSVDWKALENLINKYSVMVRATDADKVTARKRFIADLQAHKARVHQTDAAFEEDLAAQLAVWKMSRPRWEERSFEGYLVATVTRRQIEANITRRDIENYYQSRIHNFDVPEKIRAKFILLCTVDHATGLRLTTEQMADKRAQMEKILRLARGGSDFTTLARKFSEAGAPKDQSDDYVFQRGQSTAEFEAVAFALEPGAISDVITTDSGYQILQVTEKIPRSTLALDQVTSLIKSSILAERAGLFLATAKSEAAIQILDPDLRAEAEKTIDEHKS